MAILLMSDTGKSSNTLACSLKRGEEGYRLASHCCTPTVLALMTKLSCDRFILIACVDWDGWEFLENESCGFQWKVIHHLHKN